MSSPGVDRVLGGRYRLIREIARGGMAAVWEADDMLLDRRVAVKLLHAQWDPLESTCRHASLSIL